MKCDNYLDKHRDRGNKTYSGRSAFDPLIDDIIECSKNTESFEIAYYEVFYATNSSFVHFINNLVQILNFIDKSNLATIDKEMYATILASQLSLNESALVYFHSRAKYEGFDLIENYNLYRNHDWDAYGLIPDIYSRKL